MPDLLYNDVYCKSINNIVISNSPKTISSLHSMLEDNGYYGRFKIDKIDVKRSRDVCVKISLYLPDSAYSYLWPYSTYYNLSDYSFGKRSRPRVIQPNIKLIKCMYFFLTTGYNISNNLETVAKIGNLHMGWATKEEYVHMIIFLVKAGLFNNGAFVLKSVNDVNEVYENLFDYNYF